jgi:NADH-quinone oxidoreductase subunit L
MLEMIWLIPILPLIGFLINGLIGGRLGKQAVSIIAPAAVGGSFIIAVLLFFNLPENAVSKVHYTWMSVGDFHVDVALRLDHLSIIMTLVVTGVGFLIHIYSIGYIHHESKGGVARYFAYINLFSFAMLVLVLADNFLLMFVGWEGVGLCSYLLIGYWYKKDSASDAGKKAFIVNRIGDAGLLIAMFTIFAIFGSLDYDVVLNPALAAGASASGLIPLICLAIFIGATGKSAQIPLYVWLPDAMEGPTPVSALIHAATMVTAGVYMVVRCNVLYALSPDVLMVVAVVGALTAIFSATIGLAQFDIKRVLAYSTVSQLGYMFFAAGVGAYSAAIFHLVTHAFFKACLFLCSGSVIHGMHEEQDMRKMGGLKVLMPITYLTMLISTLAIAGIPPFAGFFSKDAILWAAVENGHNILWLLGAVAAMVTSFYMFRLMYMTFSGSFRNGEEARKKVHESPATMTLPLIVLAALATVAGFVGLPYAFKANFGLPYDQFGHFLEPGDKEAGAQAIILDRETLLLAGKDSAHGDHAEDAGQVNHGDEGEHGPSPHIAGAADSNSNLATLASSIYEKYRLGTLSRDEALSEANKLTMAAKTEVRKHHHEHNVVGEWIFMVISVVLALIGWFFARLLYKDKEPDIVAQKGGAAFRLLENKYYVDEIYNAGVVNPLVKGSRNLLWKFFDAGLIDGLAVNGSARSVGLVGRIARLLHTGYVQSYLFFFLVGVLVLIAIVL